MSKENIKKEVNIQLAKEGVSLKGILSVPLDAKGIVLFAHGSGSGRFSTRNQFVAEVLVRHGIATLLLDLLTKEEESLDDITRELRFDIDLLARRLSETTEWLRHQRETESLKMGYFGASTGAAAALIAGANEGDKISAIVSRGGRPDLAKQVLSTIHIPTLIIVGGNDFGVVELNTSAFNQLKSIKKMEIIPGATHLFEEPGALEKVADLASEWFLKHFVN